MLQKELAKRLKARYDTKMDGNGWLEVSSDGIPLCRIKYNGQFLSNADQNLSDEYRSKIADIQEEISTVREYVGLYEHAPQMKAADVSDYRQLAAFGDTVLAATYSEKNGFMFCTWKQNATDSGRSTEGGAGNRTDHIGQGEHQKPLSSLACCSILPSFHEARGTTQQL